MKKALLLLFAIFCLSLTYSQNYSNIVNYNLSGTPAHGVKIKTNIPFGHGLMVNLHILGYDFGKSSVLDLNLVWYLNQYYGNGSYNNYSVSSNGASIPDIWLAKENNKIVIFINEKVYYQRFTIDSFADGYPHDPSFFQNWTVVDEPLGGTNQTQVPYRNNFAGRVGIGTENPQGALDVYGTIRATEVKIETTGWSDFVFDKDYQLPSLKEVEAHIKERKHLPNIPSEAQVKEEGINIGEMQAKLLQKIEELTLYVIQQEKKNIEQEKEITILKKENKQIREQFQNLK